MTRLCRSRFERDDILEAQVVCGTGHVPNAPACLSLINSLAVNSGLMKGVSPRSICQSTNGAQCCVSWANDVVGLLEGDLVSVAVKTYNECITSALSGLARNVQLRGVCTTQCLSDRPGGCT